MDTGIDNVVFEPESDDGSSNALDDAEGWMVQCLSGDEAETVDAELFDAADGDVEAGSDSDIMHQDTHSESPDNCLSDDSESGAKTMLVPMPPWGAYPCRPALSRGGVSTPFRCGEP